MSTRALRLRAAVVLAAVPVLAAGLAACGDDPGVVRGDGPRDWPPAAAGVDGRGLVWAAGSTVHLGDGSTLDAGRPVRSFVVARGGAYVLSEGDDELRRVSAEGSEDLSVRPEPDSLAASPDGRHLVFIDRTGEKDAFGTPLAEAVVMDLASGLEVTRTGTAMGDPAADDLTDLYEELPPSVIGVDDDTAYVRTPHDVRALGLATGSIEVVADGGEDLRSAPWYDALHVELLADSPDGDWAIRPVPGGAPRLVADAGSTVTTTLTERDLGIGPLDPRPGRITWTLDSWVDARTAAGTAQVRDPLDGSERQVLVTCAVPSGACRAVPGSEDGAQVPADRSERVLVPVPLGAAP